MGCGRGRRNDAISDSVCVSCFLTACASRFAISLHGDRLGGMGLEVVLLRGCYRWLCHLWRFLWMTQLIEHQVWGNTDQIYAVDTISCHELPAHQYIDSAVSVFI